MLISIIIPVYNVAKYIEPCLRSVMNQTYQGEVECVLVDDCGTDDSINKAISIISDYSGNYNFRFIHHPNNKGLSAARNTGMEAANGDWFLFLDSDDWLLPNCLSTMTDTVLTYPDSDVIISSMESENKWVAKESLLHRQDIPDFTTDSLWVMKGLLSRPVLFPLSAWNKLYKRSFVEENHLRFLEGFIREDEIWSFHYSKYVKQVAFNKVNTYHYRENPNGIVNANKDYSSAFYSLKITDHYLRNITDFGKEIQLKLVSSMLLDAYIRLHNNSQALDYCKSLFRQLYKQSKILKKIGCIIFIVIPHQIVCKRPIYLLAKKYIFDC